MEATMQLVSKHCGEELQRYTDCVQAHPNGWHNYCEEYKVALGSCAQKNPVIQEIKEKCKDEFKAYETCLKENPSNVEACMTELEEFIQCAENVS